MLSVKNAIFSFFKNGVNSTIYLLKHFLTLFMNVKRQLDLTFLRFPLIYNHQLFNRSFACK